MDFIENMLAVLAVSFFVYLWYKKLNPLTTAKTSANNNAPYWFTAGYGSGKTFDYASQSNYSIGD